MGIDLDNMNQVLLKPEFFAINALEATHESPINDEDEHRHTDLRTPLRSVRETICLIFFFKKKYGLGRTRSPKHGTCRQ